MLRKTAIRQRKGVCVDCPEGSPEKVLIGDRCSPHYWRHRAKVNAAKEKNVSREVKKVPRETSPELKEWFDYWMCNCGNKCEETGDIIVPEWVEPTEEHMRSLRSAQAHILPKAIFKSVATVRENHMTLSARNGQHSRFDKSWSSAQQMKVWPIAVERFKTFCHLIAKEEVRRLPDVLREIYDKVMEERETEKCSTFPINVSQNNVL